MMRIHDVEQGTEIWLELRKKHRCASDSVKVMGNFGGFKALHANIPPPANSPHIARGNNLEPVACAAASKHYGVDFKPIVATDGQYLASLDGYAHAGLAGAPTKLEIKCPDGEGSKLWKAISGAIKERAETGEWSPRLYRDACQYYWWQLVHQQMVVPSPETIFFVYLDPLNWYAVSIPAEELEKDFGKLRDKWDEYSQYTPVEVVERKDDAWLITSNEYLEAKMQESIWKKRVKEHGDKIKELADGVPSQGCGVAVQIAKGSIAYKKALDDQGLDIDLENYRGADVVKVVTQ